MATTNRIKTWITGDVLTAADLNGEFNNVLNTVNGGINEDNLDTIAFLDLDNTSATETIRAKSTVSDTILLVYS